MTLKEARSSLISKGHNIGLDAAGSMGADHADVSVGVDEYIITVRFVTITEVRQQCKVVVKIVESYPYC